MNCPRCKAEIGPLSNPEAIVTCPGCGSRLMTRSAALRSQGGAARPAPPADPSAPVSPAADPPAADPSAADPPSAAPAKVKAGTDTSPGLVPQRTAVKVGQTTLSGKSTGGAVRAGRKSTGSSEVTLEMLLHEIQAVRETQQAILAALTARTASPEPFATPATGVPVADMSAAPSLSQIRAQQRKTAVLVDDDSKTREAATAELEKADIPVRAFAEGNKALSAIAQEKPDVIVLELAVGGELAGKDLVNMIKATMEWVDIPVVLWTRENVSNQREARQIHGADEVVAKSQGAAALVARVITLFRR
ncbi:MAG TPA: response regulator [Planctomycetota bacterium]|nr:response regulator [Planctomycetota bacterium]